MWILRFPSACQGLNVPGLSLGRRAVGAPAQPRLETHDDMTESGQHTGDGKVGGRQWLRTQQVLQRRQIDTGCLEFVGPVELQSPRSLAP